MWFSGSYAYSTGSPLYSDALNSETAPFAGLIALVDGSGEPSAAGFVAQPHLRHLTSALMRLLTRHLFQPSTTVNSVHLRMRPQRQTGPSAWD